MSIRTFLVDDSPETVEVLSILYKLHPAIELIGTASNIKDAWKQVGNLQIDLVSIDIQLGEGNGFDLCTQIRQAFPTVFITMCSVEADPVMRQQVFKSGADFFLSKPLCFEDIEQLVNKFYLSRTTQTKTDDDRELLALMDDLLGPETNC